MGRTIITTTNVPTTALLKRENCKHTKHDSVFSNWKILIGPCDWEDYLLNKEGAERYRTQNVPNCSSCPGIYELGIIVSRMNEENVGKLSFENVIPVYLGQADNVRTRMQQYGRDGDHLENGWANGEQCDRKILGLFSDIFALGFAIAFRWAPMESKKDAEKTESQLLKTFDYAWNREMNGNRRPADIHIKLYNSDSSTKKVFKKLHVIPPKKLGVAIKRCDPPVLENGSSFYTKPKDINIFTRIFKFGRSCPVLVSKEYDSSNNDIAICGVALGHGSVCIKPPVEGRKRCENHKGMKVNAFVKRNLNSNPDETSCGVTLYDGNLCVKEPVLGRKRCEEHKGMKTNRRVHVPGLNLETGTFCNGQKGFEEVNEERMTMFDLKKSKSTISSGDSLTCAAVTLNGSICKRKPGKDSRLCWQHEALGRD